MKKLLVFTLLLAGTQAFAFRMNESKVPAAVKSAFHKNFPGVSDAKWEKEHGKYEANFYQDGEKMSALFDEKGGWLETETDIDARLLPVNVTAYIRNHYDCKIKEAAKLKMPDGQTNYEAEVDCVNLLFDANGKFIKKSKG